MPLTFTRAEEELEVVIVAFFARRVMAWRSEELWSWAVIVSAVPVSLAALELAKFIVRSFTT